MLIINEAGVGGNMMTMLTLLQTHRVVSLLLIVVSTFIGYRVCKTLFATCKSVHSLSLWAAACIPLLEVLNLKLLLED